MRCSLCCSFGCHPNDLAFKKPTQVNTSPRPRPDNKKQHKSSLLEDVGSYAPTRWAFSFLDSGISLPVVLLPRDQPHGHHSTGTKPSLA